MAGQALPAGGSLLSGPVHVCMGGCNASCCRAIGKVRGGAFYVLGPQGLPPSDGQTGTDRQLSPLLAQCLGCSQSHREDSPIRFPWVLFDFLGVCIPTLQMGKLKPREVE